MGKIFQGQTALRISARTFADLEDATETEIRYRKPDGSTGAFAAGVVDPVKGIIAHETIEGELDAAGWWIFWAYVVFADGRGAPGEATRVFLWEEGAGG